MMQDAARWLAILILVVLALSIVGLIAYARGPKHHEGNNVGSHGTNIASTAPA
jgi:hypothetical protein